MLAALLAHPKELMGLVGAEGAACGERRGTCDVRPHAAACAHPGHRGVGRGEEKRSDRSPPLRWAPCSLGRLQASDVASGLLTFALPGAPQRRLLWFRPEIIKTVNWGGDPTKPVAADSGERLRPRHSFALWREEVRLHSHPWTASDLEAADELQRRAIEVDLERRLLSEQRAVRARDDLIAVVSHDLRNPLSAILLQAEVDVEHGICRRRGELHNVLRVARGAHPEIGALT